MAKEQQPRAGQLLHAAPAPWPPSRTRARGTRSSDPRPRRPAGATPARTRSAAPPSASACGRSRGRVGAPAARVRSCPSPGCTRSRCAACPRKPRRPWRVPRRSRRSPSARRRSRRAPHRAATVDTGGRPRCPRRAAGARARRRRGARLPGARGRAARGRAARRRAARRRAPGLTPLRARRRPGRRASGRAARAVDLAACPLPCPPQPHQRANRHARHRRHHRRADLPRDRRHRGRPPGGRRWHEGQGLLARGRPGRLADPVRLRRARAHRRHPRVAHARRPLAHGRHGGGRRRRRLRRPRTRARPARADPGPHPGRGRRHHDADPGHRPPAASGRGRRHQPRRQPRRRDRRQRPRLPLAGHRQGAGLGRPCLRQPRVRGLDPR